VVPQYFLFSIIVFHQQWMIVSVAELGTGKDHSMLMELGALNQILIAIYVPFLFIFLKFTTRSNNVLQQQ
jgi:hypothetical protein